MKKIICKKCGEAKKENEFYICVTRGYEHRKSSCKICFNREKGLKKMRKDYLKLLKENNLEV